MKKTNQMSTDRKTALKVLDSWMVDLGSGMEDGRRLVRLILSGVFLAMMLIPYQMLAGDGIILGVMTTALSAACGFSFRYSVVLKDDGKENSIYQKLCYLPITKRELRQSRWRIYASYLLKLTLCAGVLQLMTSLLGYHTFGWENLCYVLMQATVIPGVLLVLFIYQR